MAALDELVVHGWDVARASGQPFDCDPAALEACLEFVVAISPPEQRTGGDRLIGLTGRDPTWTPVDRA
jgi:hypothetical protein